MSIPWQEQQPGKDFLEKGPYLLTCCHSPVGLGLGETEAFRGTCWANFHPKYSLIVHLFLNHPKLVVHAHPSRTCNKPESEGQAEQFV